jgi:hypothetical protein
MDLHPEAVISVRDAAAIPLEMPADIAESLLTESGRNVGSGQVVPGVAQLARQFLATLQ